MNIEADEQHAFLAQNHRTVLGTIRRDGSPQMSNVVQAFLDGALEISTRETSAKVRNLRRDPRVTALVLSEESWFKYLVIYGRAEIISLPEAGPRLRTVYEFISGRPHPNWGEYDQAMVNEQRVVVRIRPERVIG